MSENDNYTRATMRYLERQIELDTEYRACLMQMDVNKLAPELQRSYYDALVTMDENERAYKCVKALADFIEFVERWLK